MIGLPVLLAEMITGRRYGIAWNASICESTLMVLARMLTNLAYF